MQATTDPAGQVMRANIDQTNRAFCEALAAGDAHAVAAVYTPDTRLLTPGCNLLCGTDQIAGFWGAGIAAGIRGAELHTLTVEEHHGHAIEVGRYSLAIQQVGAAPVIDTGKYVVVHRRDGDTWRWDVDIFNSDHPGS